MFELGPSWQQSMGQGCQQSPGCVLGCGGRECDEVLLELLEKQEIQLSETGKSVHLLSNPVDSVALRLVTTAFGKGDQLREQERSRKGPFRELTVGSGHVLFREPPLTSRISGSP